MESLSRTVWKSVTLSFSLSWAKCVSVDVRRDESVPCRERRRVDWLAVGSEAANSYGDDSDGEGEG